MYTYSVLIIKFPYFSVVHSKNTLEQKRKMRNERKKRKRHLRSMKLVVRDEQNSQVEQELKLLREQLQDHKQCHSQVESKMITYKCMAKTYWERWRFELDQRMSSQDRAREYQRQLRYGTTSRSSNFYEQSIPIVDRSMLHNPTGTDGDMVYIARGSFGIVKHQYYRGIEVAVKEFLPRSCIESVTKEAGILLKLCHPYLPMLIGKCTSTNPYIIVMQYHGVGGECITLLTEKERKKVITSNFFQSWAVVSAQLAEAVRYLHEEARILHNDLKANNVVFQGEPNLPDASSKIQIVIIDFGKACERENGRKHNLSFFEKKQYRVNFPHMAPEIIDGLMKESVSSDLYALGKLFARIFDEDLPLEGVADCYVSSICDIISQCISNDVEKRPSAFNVLKKIENILKNFSI